MAYGWSASFANKILDAMYRGVSFTPPAAVWAQLHTEDPGAAGTANVSSVTARQQLTFPATTGGVAGESTTPSWGNWAGASPETIVAISLWDASSAGVFIKSVKLVNPVAVTTGQPLTLPTFTDSLAIAA